MSETATSLRRKIGGANELGSIVRAMKAMAGSNIIQFEMAVASLGDYHRTIALGILAYFKQEQTKLLPQPKKVAYTKRTGVLVFGSDMGLVGSFNEKLAAFVIQTLSSVPGEKEIWTIGERIQPALSDGKFKPSRTYEVPASVNAVTPLVGQLIIESERQFKAGNFSDFLVFYNRPLQANNAYEQKVLRLLPLDEKWRRQIITPEWPTHRLPQVTGDARSTLAALISEYLFISLYRAAAESLAAENAARLESMQRAEKNIDEMLVTLRHRYHLIRQNAIDEELFDVIAGFESTRIDKKDQ